MVDIWLPFVPGGGASIIESIVRRCTNMEGMPPRKAKIQYTSSGNIDGHSWAKQWHPQTYKQFLSYNYESFTDNFFTPIVPMKDISGSDLLKIISKKSGKKIYIGPNTEESKEFALVAYQKVPDYLNHIMGDKSGTNKWSTKPLQQWETREYISLTLMDWWIPEMSLQWNTAKELDFICYETLEVFKHFPDIINSIVKEIGFEITNKPLYQELVERWYKGQNKIWEDWHSYCDYKKGKGKLTGDIVQEALIQYNLRKLGIELKCYGLNNFPTAQELRNFYE